MTSCWLHLQLSSHHTYMQPHLGASGKYTQPSMIVYIAELIPQDNQAGLLLAPSPSRNINHPFNNSNAEMPQSFLIFFEASGAQPPV